MMRSIRAIGLLMCIPLLLAGCKQQGIASTRYSIPLDTPIPSSALENALDIQQIIPLKGDSLFLSESISVDFAPDRIIVSDLTSKTVHIFDGYGTLIRSFSKSGNGPGEYLSMWQSGYYKETGTIEIYDSQRERILRYDLDGSFVDMREMKSGMHGGLYCRFHNHYYFNRRYSYAAKDDRFSVYKTDSLLNVTDRFLRYKAAPGVSFVPRRPFSIVQDTLVYYPTYSQTAYNIVGGNNLTPRYTLDFSGHNMDEKLFSKSYTNPMDFLRDINESGLVCFMNINESTEFIYADFMLRGKYYVAVVNKKNGKSIVAEADEDGDCKSRYKPLAVKDDCFVTLDQSNPDRVCLILTKINL